MISFELLASHREVVHRIELDGYEDFEHKGYWTNSHLCRPQLLVIKWTKENDLPWEPHMTLWVGWVRKDGSVSPDRSLRKDIDMTLPGRQNWGSKMLAPSWAVDFLVKFDQDHVPGRS
jgi:hypothetical protein